MKKRWIPFIAIAAMIGISCIATADETEMDFYISEDDSEEVLVAAAEEDEDPFAVDGLIEDMEAANDGAVENVPIDEEHFQDSSFRNYISENFDLPDSEGNKDGVLSADEIAAVTEINIPSDVSYIQGLPYFSALETLGANGNGFTDLYIADLPVLKKINLSGCSSLWMLHIVQCPALEELNNEGCTALFDVVVQSCPSLTELIFEPTNGAKLTISECSSLRALKLKGSASLKFVDMSNCSALTNLDLEEINIRSSLTIDGCYALKSLNLSNMSLSSLQVTNCTSLTNLQAHNCRLLAQVTCCSNILEQLVFDNCKRLKNLDCSNNQLKSLDLVNFNQLQYLNCGKNPLKQLDITHCSSLMRYSYQKGSRSETDGNISYYFNGTDEEGEPVTTQLLYPSTTTLLTYNHSYGAWKVVKTATALSTGSKVRMCSHCDYEQSQTIPKLKASVTLNKTKLKLKKRKKATLKIKSMTKGDQILKWTTSKKKIATVNKKGQVKAKKKGKCVITVVMKSGAKAKCTITVK